MFITLQEDKAKLLCLITELSLTPDCSTVDSRDNLQRAMIEVKNLLDKKKSEELRVKYYLRILIPLAEVSEYVWGTWVTPTPPHL